MNHRSGFLRRSGALRDGLAERLTSLFRLVKDQGHDVIFYGRTFKMTKPHQTDAAFGYTPAPGNIGPDSFVLRVPNAEWTFNVNVVTPDQAH